MKKADRREVTVPAAEAAGSFVRLVQSPWFAAGIVSAITLAIFWSVLSADFVMWDDDIAIYENPVVHGLSLERIGKIFTDIDSMMRYNPLTLLSWSATYQFFGLNPFWYHVVNWLLHGASAMLVFFVLRCLLLLGKAVVAQRVNIAAATGALLWSLHPLRVEPVAWASGYLHCQSGFFMLLSLWLYLEAVTALGTQAKRWCYWLSVLSYLASLFSFPTTLGLVPLLVILDVYPLRRFGRGPGRWWNAAALRIWLEKLPFAALALLAVGIGLLARFNPPPDWPQPVSLAQFSLFARMMQACYVWGYFLWKPWAPFGLSPVYTTLVEFNPMGWPFWLSAALVAGATVWLACKWRQ